MRLFQPDAIYYTSIQATSSVSNEEHTFLPPDTFIVLDWPQAAANESNR